MIACENLTKRFGHFTAVDHVSFSIAKGSIFGFLGPNGSGKTTVIRMLCGLLEPSDGRASIAGFDVARETAKIKNLIAAVRTRRLGSLRRSRPTPHSTAPHPDSCS